MKRSLLFALLNCTLLIAHCQLSIAQSPQSFSFQAVVRDGSGDLVTSSPVGMRISLLQGSEIGSAVYVETHTPTTNANGLASVQVGGGNVVSGTFASINWAAGPYYIKSETDPNGGTSYSITGTQQLLSVPYALYAANAGDGGLPDGSAAGNTPYWNGTSWVTNSSNIFNNGGNVGIGTSSPAEKVSVSGNLNFTGKAEIYASDRNHMIVLRGLQDGTSTNQTSYYQWGDHVFYAGGNVATQPERLRVTGTGNVGIGNSNPQNRLQVSGNLHMDGNAIYLRANPANYTQLIKWNGSTDRMDIGGYSGLTLGYTDGAAPNVVTSVVSITSQAQVGIGTAAPTASAALEVASTNKGVLLPRMTTSQRDAIGAPAEGLQLFNTTTRCLEMFGNGYWQSVHCLCADPTPAPDAIVGTATGLCQQTAYTYTINAVPGAVTYTWTVTGAPNAVIVPNGTSAQITFGANTTAPTIHVTAARNCGAVSSATARAVTVSPISLSAPVLEYPAVATDNSFVVNWSAVEGAAGYHIDVAVNNGFTSFVSGGLNSVNVGNVTSHNVTGLTTCQAYYVRVRAFNSCGVLSAHSNVETRKVYASGMAVFNYTGADQTFTLPNSCVENLHVEIWGAGGGGSGGSGGGGAYLSGTISASAYIFNQNYTVVVGGGGTINGTGTYGGGGAGPTASSGGGGGYSGIFNGIGVNPIWAVALAGGGGGSGPYQVVGFVPLYYHGGGGGGNAGLGGDAGQPGSSGGAAGTNGGAAGGPLQGGTGGGTHGGGGGGGYTGGGGGGHAGGGGGGGSYTTGLGFTLSTHAFGSGQTGWGQFGTAQPPGNTTSPNYTAGVGVGGGVSVGGNGKVVIRW